jgi:hypothetical protein
MLAAVVSKERKLKGSEKVFHTQTTKDALKMFADGD